MRKRPLACAMPECALVQDLFYSSGRLASGLIDRKNACLTRMSRRSNSKLLSGYSLDLASDLSEIGLENLNTVYLKRHFI